MKESPNPTNAVTHKIKKVTGEGENHRTIKCRKSTPVLSTSKVKHSHDHWCEEGDNLVVTKGTSESAEAHKEIALSIIGEVLKDKFKSAIAASSYNSTDDFSTAACKAATLFFDKNSADEETEHLHGIKKPFETSMQEFVSSFRVLEAIRRFMKISLNQTAPALTKTEQIQAICYGFPESWRNAPQESSTKLSDMSMEELFYAHIRQLRITLLECIAPALGVSVIDRSDLFCFGQHQHSLVKSDLHEPLVISVANY